MTDDEPEFEVEPVTVVDSLPDAPLTHEEFLALQDGGQITAGKAIERGGEDGELVTAFVVFTDDTVHGVAFPEDDTRWEQFFEADLDDDPDVEGIVALAGHVHLQYKQARQERGD